MKKLFALSLLGITLCGILAAPAQAYDGRFDRFDRHDHFRYEDHFRRPYMPMMSRQAYLQEQWQIQHPFLSLL